MKRKNLLPLFALLALTSCGGDPSLEASKDSSKGEDNASSSQNVDVTRSDDTIEETTSEDSNDESSSVDVPPIDTNSGDKTQIYDTLVAAATCGNYTIAYDEDDGNGGTVRLVDAITPNYIDRKFSKGGYVLLKSYNKDLYPDDIYYSYERNGNSINVLHAIKTTTTTDLDSPIPANKNDDWDRINPLFNAIDPNNNVTSEFISFDASRGIYSNQEAIVVACGRVLGYSSAAITGRVAEVRFGLEDDGTVKIVLYKWKNALDDSNKEIEELITGYLYNVGTSQDETLEAFRSSFSLPNKTLESDATSFFAGNKIKAKTEVNLIDNETPTWKSSIDLESNPEQRKINTRRDNPRGVLDDASYIRKSSSEYAEQVYVDGNNEIKTERLSYLWGEDNYHNISEYLDLSAFRSDNNNQFHYYGPAADGIFDSMSMYSIYFGEIRSLEAKYENGSLSFSGNGYADASNRYYEFVTKIETPTEISLEPYKVDTTTEDYTKLKKAFDYFKDDSKPFHALEVKNGANVTEDNKNIGDYYRVNDYAFYVDEWASNPSYGYKKNSDGVQPFSLSFQFKYKSATEEDPTDHYEGSASKKGELIEGKTLSDFLTFNEHPELFTKVSDNKYGAKPFVEKVGKTMFPIGDDDARDYDTYFTLNDDGLISTYEYWSPTNGYRKLTFDYNVNSIENGIFYLDEKNFVDFSSLDKVEFTTWQTGYDWFYNLQLVRLYKNEFDMTEEEAKTAANTIPYLLDDVFQGRDAFTASPSGKTIELKINSNVGTEQSRKTYANRYKEYLLQCGYELKTDSSNKQYYAGTYCDIYIGNNLTTLGSAFTFKLHLAA
ncbi:MAG TPA: hypothetical protein DEF61_02155 [Firmicutes bacterium]|nr:hypothetical protein [Bacillota bacterium]HBX25073.1 hypothetical protein [Bacillota bacterium]